MKHLLSIACSLGSLAFANVAHAQEAAPAPQKPAASRPLNQTDEIVITARRVEESLQSTPVSVTAFSGTELTKAGIRDTADLMIKTPGVYLGGSGGRENSVFQIRGMAKARSGFNSPAVVSYFADVPQPTFGSSVATYDLGSVQVLKGPQGTLFGRNTIGGAVLFYPAAPTYKVEGYVQGSYGRFNNASLEGALNIPIVDGKVALRLAGRAETSDGYTKNLVNGKYFDDTDSRAVRASLLIEPADGFKNVTIFDYYKNDYNGDSFVLRNIRSSSPLLDNPLALRPAALAFLAAQQARGARVVEATGEPLNRSRRLGITNRTDIDITDDVAFTNIFGYRRTEVDYHANVGGFGSLVSGNPALRGAAFTVFHAGAINNTEQFTNEVQFKGTAGAVDWLLGGFYLKSKPFGPTGTGSNALTTSTGYLNTFNYSFYDETSKALFGNVNVRLDNLLEGLRANAGFRYTWDKITACTATDTVTFGQVEPEDCNASNPVLQLPATNSVKFSAPTWQVGLDWQATSDLFFYAATRRGYRAGGINNPTLGGTLVKFQSYGPQKVTDVELGMRSDWDLADNVRFRFNVSGFIGWHKNIAASLTGVRTIVASCVPGAAPPVSPDGDCNVANDPQSGTLLITAGTARISGIDIDGFLKLGNFTLNYGANFLDPKSTGFSAPPELAAYVPANSAIGFDFVAKRTFTLGADYAVPLDDGTEINAHADLYKTSDIAFTDSSLDGYTLVNARLDYNNVFGSKADISLYMNNVFNKVYEQSGAFDGPGAGFKSVILGPPRQYGVRLRYRFGR
ncbi:TonB-dependent receptor [Sphingobium sp.]|uniref:TonB-dependent receptor n=1 Tax=Sphingobium sp. TaxID=1912891 RepID=UPI0025ED4563|nr:TonB-dependent receptor plug domain-containing protein [Sphingobium sp.]